jgi:multidrug resistance efflux pump
MAPVLDVRVRAGDHVRTGDILVTLDARDVRDHALQATASAAAAEKALGQARTAQAAADAQHKLATAWHARITALHARNSATEQERDEANARLAAAAAAAEGSRAGIDVAEANLQAARAAAGAASTTESFTTIRAPFDALVTERLIDPGNMAGPGTPLLRLESVGARRVEATIDESRARFVGIGDHVEIVVDADSGESSPLQGIVSEVARLVAADRRAFLVKIALPSGTDVRTGSFARVRFGGATSRALVVPASAVRRQGQVTSVFVVEANTARLRLVQVGESRGEHVPILSGLEPGEFVIVHPPPQLVDGHPVSIGARQ